MKTILVVGATSAIAEAVVRRYAVKDNRLYLVARNEERLREIAEDLRLRGAGAVETRCWEAADAAGIPELIRLAAGPTDRIDVALVAYGLLPDQEQCEASAAAAREALETNLVSVVELLTPLAEQFVSQGGGTIAVLGSVAGDRGRQSNYVYGAAKAGLSAFLQGLRNRLHGKGVAVVTIKPAFIDTPMTAGFEDKGLLWSTPQRVAGPIHRAIRRRRSVAYVPWFWRPIMFCIRAIPEVVFKRMKL